MSTTTKNITVKINAEIDKFNSAMKQLSSSLDTAKKDFEGLTKAGEAVSGLGNKLMPFTVAVTGVATASTATAISFEGAMNKVSAISGATGKDLQSLEDMAKKMGSQTKFSATESAEALTYMGMAGWDTQSMLDGLPGILSLAAAGGTQLALTSDIVTDGLTSMGLSAKDTNKFVDIMAAACSSSNTSIELMGETLKYAGSTAGALGIDMDDLSVAIGLMANSGIKGSQAGTALRAGLVNLVKPTKQMKDAMDEYGIAIQKNDDGSVDFMATMVHLREKLGGLDETVQANIVSTIFGKEAMAGWQAVINATDEDFNNLTKAIAESDGTAQKMSETMQSGASGAITEMKSAIEGVAITIGEKLLPFVEKCADWISNLCNKFQELSPEVQNAILIFGGLLAVIPPILVVVGSLMKGFATLKIASAVLGVGLGTVSAGFLLIPAAIAAVIAIIATLIANWDWVKEKAGELADKMGEAWNNMAKTFSENWNKMWEDLGNFLSDMGTAIMDWFSSVGQWFADGWNGAIEWTKNAFETMGNAISEWFTGIAETVSGWFSNVAQWFADGWNACVDKTKEVFSAIGDAVTEAFEFVGNLVEFGLLAIGELFNIGKELILLPWKFIWENCKDFIIPIFESIANFISEKLELVKNFVSEKLEAVKKFFVEKFTDARDKTKELFESISKAISEKLEQAKKFVTEKLEAIAKFFSDKWTDIKTKTTELYENIAKIVQEKLEQARKYVSEKLEAIAKFFTEKWTAIKDKTTEIYQNISKSISDALDKAKTYVSEKASAIKEYFSSKFEQAKEAVSSKMSAIKQNIQDKINSAKDIASNAINTIKSKFDVFGTIASNVKSKFDSIKSAISEKMNAARDTVKNVIDKIKGLFNITLNFPKIKVPVLGWTGKFSINPPSVPHFGIQGWKWLNKGGIFKHKTVLPSGYGVGDKSFGGVGNNPEVVAPLDKLKDMLFDGKRTNDGGLTLNISEFNNNRDYDIEKLANELAYYLKRKQAFGGA